MQSAVCSFQRYIVEWRTTLIVGVPKQQAALGIFLRYLFLKKIILYDYFVDYSL